MPNDPRTPTRLLPMTRAVFATGFALTAGTGAGLVAAPTRTADFWAWTIGAPLSAAFLGAMFAGAAVSLALGVRARFWRDARALALAAFLFTSLALAATAREPGPFAFADGGVTGLVAWVWLAVYVALPPLVLVAFARQELRGGRDEYEPELPALVATRVALGGAGALLAALGAGLFAPSESLAAWWPWPLPALPAMVVGGWVCAYGASFVWFAVREREWRRVRIGAVGVAVALVLNIGSALRFRDDFDGAGARAAYLVALVATLALLAGAAAAEERRLRRSGPRHRGMGGA